MCDLPPAHTQRLVHIQSMLKRAPSYRTLELELLEWQERELFEYFVVVSLKKKPSRNTYLPEVSYQFPKVRPSPLPSRPPPQREERARGCGFGPVLMLRRKADRAPPRVLKIKSKLFTRTTRVPSYFSCLHTYSLSLLY